jgi:transcription initiation factor TFIIIB Brf1 subunit/transcription initiation factor TFIIB
MESYLNELDVYNDNIPVKDNKIINQCCGDMDNHSVCEEKVLCRICGTNIENISYLPEKCYDNKMSSSCHGMPVSELLPDTNLGSIVQGNHYQKYNFRLIQQMNNYSSMTYKDRSMLTVFNHIADVCKRGHINEKIVDESKSIYKHISSKKISRGSNRKGIIAACVFMACKNEGCPRSSKEISKIFDCDSKIITKGIKNVNEILRVHKLTSRVKSDRVDSIDLITRFCNNISLNMEQIKEIIIVAEKFTDKYYTDLSSCTPGSLAASFIYYYVSNNDIKISKKVISENTNISVVTIQKIVSLLNNL